MAVKFSKTECQWVARLVCGHDQLVSDAEYCAGATRCRRCPPKGAWGRPQLRKIQRRWTIMEVCRHAQSS